MHVGAVLLHTPSASLSPLSLHVEVVKAKSDNPYPLSQEYVQILSKLLSFVQASCPLVGATFAGLHVKTVEKKFNQVNTNICYYVTQTGYLRPIFT